MNVDKTTVVSVAVGIAVFGAVIYGLRLLSSKAPESVKGVVDKAVEVATAQ